MRQKAQMKILKTLTVATGVAFTLLAIPVQATRALSTIWTVYEISLRPPSDPGNPQPDYPGVGSR